MAIWAKRLAGALVASLALQTDSLPAKAADKPVSLGIAAFTAETDRLEAKAAACATDPAACTTADLPGPQQVDGAPGGSFPVSWSWLGDAFKAAKGAPPATRLASMHAVQAHLREWKQLAGADPHSRPGEFDRARNAASETLKGGEFRTAHEPSWLDRKLARLQDWFLELFAGAGVLGAKLPWLAQVLEWSAFALAAAGLLLLVRRSLQRQALRIALAEGMALHGSGRTTRQDWAQEAERQAEAGDWRGAIHSIFWAAILLLESKRLWKANPARTPREYARLLRPGSEAQRDLLSLTRLFERTWYGDGQGTETAFREAKTLLERLRTSRPERLADEAPGPAAPVAIGGA